MRCRPCFDTFAPTSIATTVDGRSVRLCGLLNAGTAADVRLDGATGQLFVDVHPAGVDGVQERPMTPVELQELKVALDRYMVRARLAGSGPYQTLAAALRASTRPAA